MQLTAAGVHGVQAGFAASRYALQRAPKVLSMTSVSSLNVSTTSSAAVAQAPQAAPANASAELAKYESQLSDWVHCASSKTSAGKAKIAEITDKIESIKAQVKRAEDAKPSPRNQPAEAVAAKVPQRLLRLDQLGTWLDVRA